MRVAGIEVRTQEDALAEARKLIGQQRRAVDDFALKVEAARSRPTRDNINAMHAAEARVANLRQAASLMLHTMSALPLGRDIRKPATGG